MRKTERFYTARQKNHTSFYFRSSKTLLQVGEMSTRLYSIFGFLSRKETARLFSYINILYFRTTITQHHFGRKVFKYWSFASQTFVIFVCHYVTDNFDSRQDMLSPARSPWKIKRVHTPWLINTTLAIFKTGLQIMNCQ